MFRHIVHLHIPAFPIAVARVRQPELRDRPVAVVPAQSARSVILTVSSEGGEEGIFRGMPLGKAKRLCPDLTLIPPNPELVETAFRSLTGLVARYTPLWEPTRPGDIYLDLTGTERLWGQAKDTGHRLRQEVHSRLNICGTVGVAGNKMVSNIASRIIPTEGVLDVVHGHEARFMAPLKVEVVPGIDRFRRNPLLKELNITRVKQLAALDMGNLRLVFGRQAPLMRQRALGIDPTPVYPAPLKPAISEEITLSQDENDDRRLLGILYRLVERGSRRLRTRSLVPQRAGLLIRYSDQIESKRRLKLPRPSFWDFDLYGPLAKLFLKTCHRRVRIRYMKIWFWGLRPDFQLPLFDKPAPDTAREIPLIRAVDQIRQRYGETAIEYGKTG